MLDVVMIRASASILWNSTVPPLRETVRFYRFVDMPQNDVEKQCPEVRGEY
ncbi:MAG: hypothetical protein ACD_10C00842G0002 [uncultured bacterium]|nr:MAG: hypothetical protein ACD_10C00842G0002 [uncultured bacterium]